MASPFCGNRENFLLKLCYLQHIRRQVLIDGQAAGVHNDIAGLYESSFLQDQVLVMNDIIYAFFFGIMKGSYTPAKAQLVDQALFLGENIQG